MSTVWLKCLSYEARVVVALLACGAGLRVMWAAEGQNPVPYFSESYRVGAALAQTGRFADPFGVGTGATAHVGMLTPLPSAAAYWLFGAGSPTAELALSIWAAGLVSLGLWLCWRLAHVLEIPPPARLAAVAFVALVPLQFKMEVREGRNWEVNLAVVLLVWILLRIVTADRAQTVTSRDLLITGAIGGLLFIVSPPAGLAAIAVIGIFQLLRLPVRQWWIAPAAICLVAGSLGGFWAARNQAALGEPIALRDNLGLELDLANYSGAVHPADPRAAFFARLFEIHPIHREAGLDAMRAAGGELPYYHKLSAEVGTWVRTHPLDFLLLSARHFAQFYLPPLWFWYTYGHLGLVARLQHFLVLLSSVGGICTLAYMAWRRRAYVYLLTATLMCSAPYVFVQPTLRYRYLISSLLIFLAFGGAGLLMHRVVKRRSSRYPAANVLEKT
ncbi:MAG: hypothetical protein P4M15_10015 [Alphaproteobacteria bacterium]|nr:hypothetical protein [Alphaproteobacteria bacterium]